MILAKFYLDYLIQFGTENFQFIGIYLIEALLYFFFLQSLTMLIDETGHILYLTLKRKRYKVLFNISRVLFLRRIIRASVTTEEVKDITCNFYSISIICVLLFHLSLIVALSNFYLQISLSLSLLFYVFNNIRHKDSDLNMFLKLYSKRKTSV